MLSALVASPTLDLGVRSRIPSSKTTSSATADSTTAAAASPTVSPVTRAAISIEYASLRHDKHCPTGMYVLPSVESLLVWDAVLFVHKGHYAGSVLKFVVSFPDSYPDRPPTVHFMADVFHPLVASQTGMFNLSARFRPWRPREHHVHDILYSIKTAFKDYGLGKLNEADAVNKEAFKYTENRSSFAALAQQSSQLSQSPSALYNVPSSRKAYLLHFARSKPEQFQSAFETFSIRTTPTHAS